MLLIIKEWEASRGHGASSGTATAARYNKHVYLHFFADFFDNSVLNAYSIVNLQVIW